MNRLATLGGLSLRELWIGYRLLLAVLAFALSGLVAAIAPAPGWRPHAAALALAIAATAGLVASAVAGDRLRGFVGWLVARSVPRATVAVGWLLAASISALAGVSLALLTASSVSGSGLGGEAVAQPSLVVAVAATGVAAAGVAIALGLLLPPRLALPITTAVVAAWLAPMAVVAPPDAPLPGGGLALLADLGANAPSSGAALRVAGATLASAALAWAAAIVVAIRIDL